MDKFEKFSSFLFLLDGPGISFTAGIVCPQASQTCCDTPPSVGKDIPRLNLLSIFLTTAGKELVEENIFFLAHRLNKMYHRSSSCRTSPSC